MSSITKLIITLSFLLAAFIVKAQDKEVLLFGKVKNDSILLENIDVINLRTKFGTSSLENGEYYIKAKAGDSIWYKSLEYKNRKVIISNDHIEQKVITVFLEPQVNQLDTVTISGSIKLDLSNVYMDKDMVIDKDKNDYIAPPSVLNQVDPNAAQGGIDVIGLAIRGADALFFKKKREQKRQEGYLERKKIIFVENIVYTYKEKFFTEELKINRDRLYQFVDYCEAKGLRDYYNKSEIEVKNFLIILSREFNNL